MRNHRKLLTVFVLLVFVGASTAYAVNKILVAKGTALIFADSAQTPTQNLTLSALAAGTGCTTACTRCSAVYTKAGAYVKNQWWTMRPRFTLTGTNVVNEAVNFYVATYDGTNMQGNISTSDGTIDINKVKNLTFVGTLVVDQTTTNTTMAAAFPNIYIGEDAFSVCVSNQTTLPFQTSTSAHRVTMTPMNIEVQNNE
jgi:hypothetical protein